MRIKTSHWMYAGLVAVAAHAAIFLGWQNQLAGANTEPPAGPSIEMADSLAGIMGAAVEIESSEVSELIEAAEPDVVKPVEPETPTDVAMTAPVVAPSRLPDLVEIPTADVVKEVKTKEPKVKKKPRKKVEKKKTKPTKKKKTAKRSGNSKRGAGGKSKGAKGRSRFSASAGAIRSYASQVRARVLSRAPRGGSRRGTTVVSFGVSKGGGLRYARVARSSGNPGLDRKALGAVRRAAPFPRPPAGASNRQLAYTISFRFR